MTALSVPRSSPVDAPAPVPDDPVERLVCAYLEIRARGYGHRSALHKLVAFIETRGMDPEGQLTDEALVALADDGNWQARWREAEATEELRDETLSPLHRLRTLKGELLRAEKTVNTLWEALNDPSKPLNPVEVAQHRSAVNHLILIQQQTGEAEAALRRTTYEAIDTAHWDTIRETMYSELTTQYGELGPQYRALCRRLANLEVRIQQMEASGRDVQTNEYGDLVARHTALVNQLQKYTEATKAEVIRQDVQNAIVKVLELVEGVVAPTQPQLWLDVVQTVGRRITASPVPVMLGDGRP